MVSEAAEGSPTADLKCNANDNPELQTSAGPHPGLIALAMIHKDYISSSELSFFHWLA